MQSLVETSYASPPPWNEKTKKIPLKLVWATLYFFILYYSTVLDTVDDIKPPTAFSAPWLREFEVKRYRAMGVV